MIWQTDVFRSSPCLFLAAQIMVWKEGIVIRVLWWYLLTNLHMLFFLFSNLSSPRPGTFYIWQLLNTKLDCCSSGRYNVANGKIMISIFRTRTVPSRIDSWLTYTCLPTILPISTLKWRYAQLRRDICSHHCNHCPMGVDGASTCQTPKGEICMANPHLLKHNPAPQ